MEFFFQKNHNSMYFGPLNTDVNIFYRSCDKKKVMSQNKQKNTKKLKNKKTPRNINFFKVSIPMDFTKKNSKKCHDHFFDTTLFYL